jgi:hypothetical protein
MKSEQPVQWDVRFPVVRQLPDPNGSRVEGDEKYPDVIIELYSHPWGLARILLESIDKKTCWK